MERVVLDRRELRWRTLEALRASNKGRLKYHSHWQQDEDILEGCISPIMLSAYSGQVLDKMLQQSPEEVKHSGNSTPQESTTFTNQSPSVEVTFANHCSSSPRSPTEPSEAKGTEDLGPEMELDAEVALQPSKYMLFEGCIRMYEKMQRMEAQERLRQRQEQFQQVVKSLYDTANEQLKRYDEMRELKRLQELQDLQEAMEKSSREAQGQQEKLKEEHRHRAKILNLKLREAEQQRQRQEEQERLRKEEGQERLRRLYSIQEEVLQLNQQIDPNYKHKDLPKIDLSAYSSRGNQICGLVSGLIRTTSERGFPTQADVANAEQALQEMRGLIASMQQEIAAAVEEKRKKDEEERQRQNELLKKEQMKAQTSTPAQQAGGQQQQQQEGLEAKTDEGTMQWYQQLQDAAKQCAASFSRLANCAGNMEVKRTKADLQKAATTPVSQISTRSGSHLKQIFDKISNLLSGKPVQNAGKTVSVTQHPEGLDFVYYKVAEKFVHQAEAEIAANHDSAFTIAVLVLGIWETHPRIGDLILAHLHEKCPYAVPFYPTWKEGASVQDQKRMLGYIIYDDGIESQESFLKRMSGMIRFYAALIHLRWPYSSKQGGHPHGLSNGWRWLAQMLNMAPMPDVTATVLFDFLEVCGNALMKQYDTQFWKMVLLMQEEYIPRIEAVTSSGQTGSLSRLKGFLQECLQQKEVPLPKGALSPSFWKS